MPCHGLAADIYDLYVLGLLEGSERAQLEAHIHEQCSACLRGVQRSMNLWVVFATTLEDAEPSTDFRARLIRIAELSRKVLTFRKGIPMPKDPSRVFRWSLLVWIAVLTIFVFASWYAGRLSGGLDNQRLRAELNRVSQQLALAQLQLSEQVDKTEQMNKALRSSGKGPAAAQQSLLRRQLSQAQAQANQYKAIVDRERQAVSDNKRLIDALSNPGARLINLKGDDAAADSIAYALIVPNSKLIFVAANLPKLAEGRQFQLWLVRKDDPKIVSAGIFNPDDNQATVMSFDEGSVLSGISELEVTEEREGGNSTPTGTKLFEGDAELEE